MQASHSYLPQILTTLNIALSSLQNRYKKDEVQYQLNLTKAKVSLTLKSLLSVLLYWGYLVSCGVVH